jgi:mono/diheme cytochrome c family protein
MALRVRVFLALVAVVVVWHPIVLCQDRPKEVSKGPPGGLSLEERGYWTLLNKPLGIVTLTEVEYDSIWKVWPGPLREKAEKASPRERRAMALERYGFQDSPDRPAGSVPQQFTPDGKGGLAINCLACHGGKVAGKVVRGLGNSHINLATFSEDVVKLFTQTERKTSPWPKLMPVEPEPPVRGVSNAFISALVYLSVRDRDMEVTPNKLQFTIPPADDMNIPLIAPAFWHAHRKQYFYCDGFVEKSHRDIMQFSFEPSLPGKTVRGWEDDFKAIYAWISSVRAPKYPWEIDTKLAERGRAVFNKQCARCHGKYGTESSYPERLIDVEDVGTDPVRANLSLDFKKHLGQSWLGDYGKTKLRTEQKAYVAPPLDGVWATAPYLHNGSIPTVWHLLNPDKRPSVWLRSEDGYDKTKLGLDVKEMDHMPEAVKTAQERRLYYQTKLRGLNNEGHRYPAKGLSEDEIRAVLEYLKTL